MSLQRVSPTQVKVGDKLTAFCRRGKDREKLKDGWVVELTTTHARLFNPYLKNGNGEMLERFEGLEWLPINGKKSWMERSE